ncbi:uncharacterized protein BXZ73DRAFT_51465 [Epithele typhae]|uniref:uncharacterized protein n=1 Tax=Epithele typhae TaxID=378194 RepID=UPI002007DEE3|nr:uncharacterized protein BXZ73DRAFT_51465 [Epithele typhae]KAH9922023.1 hypothetical protein BXZ73DRAFT_51465 [Epithele typhae]
MATVIDVSSSLGEYMLKGWVLTDKICSQCSRVPLMRSPATSATQIHFCVNCDAAPESSGSTSVVPPAARNPPPTSTQRGKVPVPTYSPSSKSYSSAVSRASTPPTEVSNAPSSPPLMPVMDTAELLRRRRQSDLASAEIGKRMLKGWAMLADECPNSDCYGIPLVRPPKSGASLDPRKAIYLTRQECVICAAVYVDEKDAFGRGHLVPMPPPPSSAETFQALRLASEARQTAAPAHTTRPMAKEGFGAAPQPVRYCILLLNVSQQPISKSATASALEATALSLERTLLVLSERMNVCSSALLIDPISIGQTAEAITKTSQALTQVKQLLWSETQALQD